MLSKVSWPNYPKMLQENGMVCQEKIIISHLYMSEILTVRETIQETKQ